MNTNSKLKVSLVDGRIVEIRGERFTHYVDNCRFWFLLHHSINGRDLTITHYDSGKIVSVVPPIRITASRGDEKRAAKREIDDLAARIGKAKLRATLTANSK